MRIGKYRKSVSSVEDVYLIHTEQQGCPWYLVSEHGGVMLSGITANDQSHYSYVIGYITGCNTQTVIRKQLVEIDYVYEDLPEDVPLIINQMYSRGEEFYLGR